MLFLFAHFLLMYFHCFFLLRGILERRPAQSLTSTMLLGIGALGLITGLGLNIDPSKGVAGNAVNWCIWLFLAFALGSIVASGAKVLKSYRSGDLRSFSWRNGISAGALVAGVYMALAVGDHLAFFYRDQATADPGFVNLDFVEASDVPCKGIALARTEEDVIRYRCPDNIAFGSILYRDPFVPWPSYTEGTSKELKDALDALRSDAIQAPASD